VSKPEQRNRDPDFIAEAQTRFIERLHASETSMRELLQDLPAVVFRLDTEGRLLQLNQAWERLLGVSAEAAMEQPLSRWVAPVDQPIWSELRARCRAKSGAEADHGDSATDGDDLRFVAADGRELWLSVTLRQREGGDQVGILQDITVQRELISERLKAQRLESVGRLAGGLAHDLNNLLMAILGNLDLVRDTMSDQGLDFAELDLASRACDRASSVTRQMLTFSKGGAPIVTSAWLGPLVQEVAALSLAGAASTWELKEDQDVPPVRMDAGQIHQVVSNLLINADQAMPDGGHISLSIAGSVLPGESPGSTVPAVALTVEDSGCGIPEADLDTIFDPYFTSKAAGTGLGLTSSYWIVQRHSGSIDVVSEVGRGSTFRVLLPASEETPAPAAGDAVDTRKSDRLKVLVMDDNEMVLASMRAMLEACGHDVTTSTEGEGCVEAFAAAASAGDGFHLVFLDLTVPGGKGGIWAMDRLRQVDPRVRSLVVSGYGNDEALADFTAHGFKGRLMKPFRLKDLREVIHEAMRD